MHGDDALWRSSSHGSVQPSGHDCKGSTHAALQGGVAADAKRDPTQGSVHVQACTLLPVKLCTLLTLPVKWQVRHDQTLNQTFARLPS